jgi:chloride channel protein, CIC family
MPNLYARGYQLWLQTKTRFSPTERQRLFGLTIAIGGVCGLVAVAFHEMISWVESVTIELAFTADGDAWMFWVIAIPTVGALLAGVLLQWVPNARGSGIPQVSVAYATTLARLRVRDAFGKFAICSLQLGTGSSMGREGPTVQICSGIAKGMGVLAGVSPQNLKLLLPVGSAAGIAAAFNAPIAAVTFTIEEIVGKLDQTLLSGVIVAAALAAVVERSVLGENPVFSVPRDYGLDHASSLLLYAALGIAAALVSVAFTETLLWVRKRFMASRIPLWLRPAIGGLVTGVLAVATMLLVKVGGITGGGYPGLDGALSGRFVVEVLVVLGAMKLFATVFSYASGGAGGIFAPTLFLGAMLGGVFGALDVHVFDHAHSEVGAFALVGMGAVFAGTIRAPITSVLIILEMTAGYGLTLPLMIANMMAYGLARQLRPAPIYERLLAQDGIHLEPKRAHDVIDGLRLDRVEVEPAPTTFAPDARVTQLLELAEQSSHQEVFPVVDTECRLVGIITLEDLAMLAVEHDLDGLVRATDIMRPPVALGRRDSISRAMRMLQSIGVRELPVIDDAGMLVGLVEEAAIARELVRAHTTHGELDASGVRPIIGP